ncbi:MAG: hypothetical protein ABL892_11450 [Thiobacillaceae bacterium]
MIDCIQRGTPRRARACRHARRSTEVEIRDILEAAEKPGGRIKPGSLLADIGRELGALI